MNSAFENRKQGKTVLVADDNPLIRAQVRQLFLSDGFALCVEAANGKEAIELASLCTPDVIVLDLTMPVMSGILAAPKLRGLLPNTPIILFSLYGDELKTEKLGHLGISARVAKNGPIDTLLEKAHQLLNSGSADGPRRK